jgi:DNA-binding CsgD family transcriptional regulator
MSLPNYAATIEAIYDAAARPVVWTSALERIADYVGGSGAMLAYSDFRRQSGTLVIGRLREDLSDIYLRHYTSNPLAEGIMRGQIVAPVLGSTLADLRRSAMHADILEPQRIADQAMVGVASLLGKEGVGGFSVTLSQRQADRGAEVLERLGRLAPHLSRAVQLSLDMARHRDGAATQNTLLGALPTAALLLGRNGLLLEANEPAEAMLRESDGLTIDSDRQLHALHAEDERRLRHAIAAARGKAIDEERRLREGVRVARPSGRPPYLVIATPLPPSSFLLREMAGEAARTLVQIIDPTAAPRRASRMLRQGFGLTAAEARVAVLIATGLGAPQVAMALGVTVNTVRTHVARCFEKTGVRSQVVLARLISAMADQ